jgi:hypothetical protein
MNFRFPLLSGVALLVSMAGASAASTPVPSSPGSSPPTTTTNAQPSTPAPPQPNAQSAPGAAAPTGSNGTTAGGAPATKAPATGAAPGATAATPPKPADTLLDKYLKELTDTLKLSADEQKEIQAYYLQDGAQLQKILNDPSFSPLQQAQQASDLRDARDTKIEAVLIGADRVQEFYRIEARYRVALTELAAQGGLVPATPVAVE